MRVVAGEDQWTWGARIRMTGDYAEFPDQWALPGSYTHVAAGDVDQDGDDDLVLSGPKMLLLLDREEEPTGACIAEIPVTDAVNAVGLAELDGAAPPELLLGAAPGIVAYTLHWSP